VIEFSFKTINWNFYIAQIHRTQIYLQKQRKRETMPAN